MKYEKRKETDNQKDNLSDGTITLPTGKSSSLSQMMRDADRIKLPESDLVAKLVDMMNHQTYYDTKGNVYLMFGIIYANQIDSINHAIDILTTAHLVPGTGTGQVQKIMDGKRLGMTLRMRNMI